MAAADTKVMTAPFAVENAKSIVAIWNVSMFETTRTSRVRFAIGRAEWKATIAAHVAAKGKWNGVTNRISIPAITDNRDSTSKVHTYDGVAITACPNDGH